MEYHINLSLINYGLVSLVDPSSTQNPLSTISNSPLTNTVLSSYLFWPDSMIYSKKNVEFNIMTIWSKNIDQKKSYTVTQQYLLS